MSARGSAWRKGGHGALYLGDGHAGQVLSTRSETERPAVALYKGEVLLATRPGYRNLAGEVVVTWDGKPLETTHVAVKDRHHRAQAACYRANVPTEEET